MKTYETTNLKTGWLSPDGELYHCGSYDHVSEAERIVSKFGYELNSRPADDVLYDHRWVYIGISCFGDHEWRIGWTTFLTEPQKQFVAQYMDDIIPINYAARCRFDREMDGEL